MANPDAAGSDNDAARLALRRVRVSGQVARRRKPRRARDGADGGRDPQLLGELMETLIEAEGWSGEVAAGSVVAGWERLVGAEVAQHCQPAAIADGVLRVATDSTAWATQMRLLTPQLLARIHAEVGPDAVTQVVVSGPVAPTWKRGRMSVPGRGPRDTYG